MIYMTKTNDLYFFCLFLSFCVWIWHSQLTNNVFFFFCGVQYLPRCLKMKKGVMLWDGNRCDRYGMMLCIPVVWLFAQLLTSSGVYDHKPQNTQTSCRTDRTGLISNTPWSVLLLEMFVCFFCLVISLFWYSYFIFMWTIGYTYHIHFNGEAQLST